MTNNKSGICVKDLGTGDLRFFKNILENSDGQGVQAPGKARVCNKIYAWVSQTGGGGMHILHFCRTLTLRQWVLHGSNDFESCQISRFSEIDHSMRKRIEVFTEIISHKKRNSFILWKLTSIHICKQSPYGDLRHRSRLLPQSDDSPLFQAANTEASHATNRIYFTGFALCYRTDLRIDKSPSIIFFKSFISLI